MISVIVPVYNVEAFLPECLDSIIGQTHADLEIIIVNDGSTDACPAICDAYAHRDSRIRVIHQENRGLSAARNRGIEVSNGEYLSFVDSDDFLLPDMLEHMLSLIREYEADFMQCECIFCSESDGSMNIQASSQAGSTQIFNAPQEKMEAFIKRHVIKTCAWGKLYRRELFRNIRFPEGKIYEDIPTTLLLVHDAKRIAVTSRPGYIYRARRGSITHSRFTRKQLDHIDAYLFSLEFIGRHYPEFLVAAQANLLISCCSCMLSMARDGHRDMEIDSRIRRLICKHANRSVLSFIPLKPRLFAFLAHISYPAAKAAAYLLTHFIPKYKAS